MSLSKFLLSAPICVGAMIACNTGIVLAQQAPSSLQLNVAWQHYSEQQMSLKGPELGVHWQRVHSELNTLEVDAVLGLQKYSSTQSGRLNQLLNLDTRWQFLRTSELTPHWHFGIALHTHSNFFRGNTSLGFGGYDRLSTQLWLPVRWQQTGNHNMSVGAGLLLMGEHISRLSQLNSSFQDVTNKQTKGVYLQFNKKMNSSHGELEPYLRWTWVDNSDVRSLNLKGQKEGAFEPSNNRIQLGVKFLID